MMKKENWRLTLAVSGLNNIDSPGPGVAVIRGLRASGRDYRIVGLAYDNAEPGIYLPGGVDIAYQVPYPASGRQALKERLLALHKIEGFDLVIPCFDAELPAYLQLVDELKAAGINSFLPTLEQFEARHKDHLPIYCREHGINTPFSAPIHAIEQLTQLVADKNNPLDYPLMIKGRFYEAFRVYSLAQAASCFTGLVAKWGLPAIVQQYLPGGEVNVVALGDGKGGLSGAVAMKKLYITQTGKAWSGVTIHNEELLQLAARLMASSKWRGPLELEIMLDSDDKPFLIEINPRFPAWVYLAVAAGQNLPQALVDLALGRPVELGEYRAGVQFVRYSWDAVAPIEQRHDFTSKGWFSPPIDAANLFSPDEANE